MKTKHRIIIAFTAATAIIGTAYALTSNPRAGEIVAFNPGHTHEDGGTHGAPQHSGGTDKYGCHNASVPYHCH